MPTSNVALTRPAPLKFGTSAERQVKTFEAAKAKGNGDEDALKAVVDELLRETLSDT